MKLASSDIIPLIYDFFLSCGYTKLAEKIKKKTGFDDVQGGLRKKKLLKICKYYVKNHQKLLDYYYKKSNEDHNIMNCEQEKEEVSSKKTKYKRKSEEEDLEIEPNLKKKLKKDRKKKIKKKKKKTEQEQEQKGIEADQETKEDQKQQDQTYQVNGKEEANGYSYEPKKRYNPPPNRTFSRIDHSKINNYKEELQDNSFNQKFKYGSGDNFGIIGYNRLIKTRGKGFKKEKTKFKNKNFQGGHAQISTTNVNSISLL